MEKNEKIWFVYILQSQLDNSFYVGMATDVQNRLMEHNKGKSKYTKSKIPWKLLYFEKVGSRIDARAKEKYYKTSSGKNKILNQLSLTNL